MENLHAALDAPDQGVLLVAAEIVLQTLAQQRGNHRQTFPDVLADAIAVFLSLDFGKMGLMIQQFPGQVLDRGHEIHQPCTGGALRHSAHGVRVELRLRQSEAAELLDRLDADGAIAADARQHDPDRAVLLVFGERGEKRVDRAPMLARRRRSRDPQYVAFHR